MKNTIVSKIRSQKPLVHCITNYVTANDCANALLAIGARPIMAEHPKESAEITFQASALALNIGCITDDRLLAMRNSLECANKNNIPVVFDAVGAASSTFRRKISVEFSDKVSIIKGNACEIMSLFSEPSFGSGVDSGGYFDKELVMNFAKRKNAVVMISGEKDYITDGKQQIEIPGGSKIMKSITGMGCILNVICGACLAVESDVFAAAKHASEIVSAAGRTCSADKSGTFRTEFIDKLYELTDMKLEEINGF